MFRNIVFHVIVGMALTIAGFNLAFADPLVTCPSVQDLTQNDDGFITASHDGFSWSSTVAVQGFDSTNTTFVGININRPAVTVLCLYYFQSKDNKGAVPFGVINQNDPLANAQFSPADPRVWSYNRCTVPFAPNDTPAYCPVLYASTPPLNS